VTALAKPTPDSVPAHIRAVIRQLSAAGYEAWLVGGAVRDLCRGAPAKDFDVATAATPAEMAKVFGPRRTIPTGEKHGTMTILVDRPAAAGDKPEREHVEVTTFRGEGTYSDGRRPDAISFVRTIEEDLARRDFTMNALAYDPERDELRDPFGGRDDLAAGIVRAVGDPIARFSEDGLRPLRAVRFCAQHDLRLDSPTEAAIPATIAVFRKVSAERVRDELLKILASKRPSLGLRLLLSTGLLHEILPELEEGVGMHQNRYHSHDVWEHTLATVDAAKLLPDDPSPWLVRLGALLHDVAKPRTAAPKEGAPGEHTFFKHDLVGADMARVICERLKLSNRDRDRVSAMVLNHMFWYTPEWTDGTVRRFIGRIGPDELAPLFALREADVAGRGRDEDPASELAALRARVDSELQKASALKITDLNVRGPEVIAAIGRPPGPIVGEVLRRMLERVIDDPQLNTKEALLALVPELVAAIDAGKP
jgi:tRNA nucleotidyltransferase (CCA-adding enzyme)